MKKIIMAMLLFANSAYADVDAETYATEIKKCYDNYAYYVAHAQAKIKIQQKRIRKLRKKLNKKRKSLN